MKKLDINNKEKIIVISVMGIPMLLLFCWIFFNWINDDRTRKDIYLDYVIDDNCFGKVDSIYRQKMNHNIMILKTNKCEFQVEAEWESYFKVGDSISKQKGQLILKHYRKGKLINTLDYNKLNR